MIKQIDKSTLADIIPLFDAYRIFYQKESDLSAASSYLIERVDNDEAVIFAYYPEQEKGQEQAQKAVAFTLCYFTFSSTRMAKTLQLNDLFVLPEYRNKKVGEQLIDHVFAYAQENGYASVGIETADDNHGAQKLYTRKGFVQDTSIHYTYKDFCYDSCHDAYHG